MRYVLVVSAHKVTAFASGRSGFDEPVIFANNVQDIDMFRLYLLERADSVFSIVLDTQDEEHHLEKLPALRSTDRKLALKALNSRLQTSSHLRVCRLNRVLREAAENWQLCAIHVGDNPDCSRWLETIENAQTLVESVVPVSLLAVQICRKLELSVSVCVLRMDQSHYRLIGFHEDVPVINRHVETTGESIELLLNEIQKTIGFVDRHQAHEARADSTAQTLVAVVGQFPDRAVNEFSAANIAVVAPNEIQRNFPVGNNPGSYAQAVMVSLMLSKKVIRDISMAGDYLWPLKRRRVRHGMLGGIVCFTALSMASAVAAINITGKFKHLYSSGEQSSRLILQEQSDWMQPDYLAEGGVEALRQSVELARQLEQSAETTPLQFLSPLAVDLSLYPEVAITRVDWLSTESDDFPGLQGSIATQTADHGYQATVIGYLNFQDAELTEAVSRFNGFVQQLSASRRYRSVTVVEAPFGISDDAKTVGRTANQTNSDFVLSLHVEGDQHE